MESTPQQTAEGLATVRVLSAVLDRLVTANAHLARADPGQVTKFHAMKAPGIGIEQYLERYVKTSRLRFFFLALRLQRARGYVLFEYPLTPHVNPPNLSYPPRIHKYASCSNECFILALIYIDRLIQQSNFLLTELNVHRVVITAVLLAAKFFDDAYYNNAYYAKVGGVLVSEMNGLEVDFLFRINFSLHVTPDVFDKYRAELHVHSTNAAVVSPVMSSAAMQQQQVTTTVETPCISAPLIDGFNRLLRAPSTNTAVTDEQCQLQQQTQADAILTSLSQRITPTLPVEVGSVEMDTDQQQQVPFQQQQQDLQLCAMAAADSFLPLQRTNLLPAVSIQQQQQQEAQNIVAAAAAAAALLIAPQVSNPNLHIQQQQHNPLAPPPPMPAIITSTTYAGAKSPFSGADQNQQRQDPFDPFLAAALENQIYPLHAAAAAEAALMNHHHQQQQRDYHQQQGGGFRCHQPPPGVVANGGSVYNNLVSQMLAGVSGAGL